MKGCKKNIAIITFMIISEILVGQSIYTTYQDNGTIKVGRDSVAGGSIVWLGESSNPNIVNNWDYGRQIQMNVRDLNGDYNPTQAGDGPNPSKSLIYYTDTNFTFSKCNPLLFYNLPPYTGPPNPAPSQLFFMWTEFLPNSNNRGLLVKTYYENKDPRPGKCFNNFVSPGDYLNYNPFTKLSVYNGNSPWTGGSLTDVTDPTGDFISTRYSMTERWHALLDNTNYGLAHLGAFSYGDLLFYNVPGSETKSAGGMERFAMRIEPGDTMQQREGWGIYYLGNVHNARTFFSQYKPVTGGNFTDNFSDERLLNWYRNNNPIQVNSGAVKVGPDNSWVNDLSLINKFYGDATYSVDIKHQSGTSWYGMAIRKTGMEHFWETGNGYYLIYLTPSGGLVLYTSNGGTLASATVPGYVASNWNNLSVFVTGFNFNIKVNGATYITYTDPSQQFKEGYVSLVNDKNIIWFDNFSVTSIGDNTPPASVTNTAISQSNNMNVLTWTNPLDVDWRWTRIMRKEGSYSNHWRDGYPVYEGKLSRYKDVDINSGSSYCYTIYTCDHAGNYSIGVNLNCILSSINDPLSTSEQTFRIYPNPFSSSTTFQSYKFLKGATLTVYNSYGGTVKQIKNISGQTVTLQRDNLPSGLYFILLTEDNITLTVDKLVITDN